MGWTFTQGAKKQDIVNRLIKPWESAETKAETLAYKVVGKTRWTVSKRTKKADGKVDLFSGCYLLDSDNGWGYKDMCESMHPYNYDCPLKFLDMVPVACQEWRDGVVAWHAKNARTFNVGDTVKLQNCHIPEVTIVSVKPFRGEYQGKLYRLKKDLIAS